MLKLFQEKVGQDSRGRFLYKISKITKDFKILTVFNEEKELIDLSVLKTFVGELIEVIIEEESQGQFLITKYEDHVNTAFYAGPVIFLDNPLNPEEPEKEGE